ncbi:hypothetical protein DDE18_12305 [Nocardioides gansuensis]|uniref:Integral membrane protein n=1 Tax=Nocardioides gansuensis TaxID=2138300 RepID=A0A2T8F9B3_9ACTN|nr:hypothetical protein [Nocardioides gansuensis]PVG82273.1 hypothetical protein DDE18_12305 [Nocardioides gansuensis]
MGNPPEDTQVDRGKVARGGLVGAGIGVALLALSLFFLVRLEADTDVLGVFLPLAAGLVTLGLGAIALLPLRLGDTPSTAGVVAWAFRGLALLGIAVTAAGVARGELPWIAFGLVPLLACAALAKDSMRLARKARGD